MRERGGREGGEIEIQRERERESKKGLLRHQKINSN